LTRSELIAELAAANTQLRGEDVEIIVATIFDGLAAALTRGDRVELRDFGAFTVRRRDPASDAIRAMASRSRWRRNRFRSSRRERNCGSA
jgi:nucleoid DNA-binding protein